jgi:thiamine biosynthesis protein ThiI
MCQFRSRSVANLLSFLGVFLLRINVTFSEAMLKGGNRTAIENRTVRNLLVSLAGIGDFKAIKKYGRLVLTCEKFDMEAAKTAISRVFGIEYFSFSLSSEPKIKAITELVLANSVHLVGHKIKVDTKRADKGFSHTSQEVNAIVGKELVAKGCSVDLKNPEHVIFIDIMPDEALVYSEKIRCFGGLPVGASGKVLSLLSGGIDSPVSSLLMMKRGCNVDFLHFHNYPTNKEVLNSKMARLAKKIMEYSPVKQKFFIVPYTEFYKATMNIDQRLELVIFRRFILHLANKLARRYRYKGVVTGDSLGQVASQTAENLFATDEAANLPVYRPLISFNKQEIVDLAKKFGTFEVSIEPYKDCCSLVATKNPSTKVWLQAAKKIEEEIGIDKIVDRTLEQVEVLEI